MLMVDSRRTGKIDIIYVDSDRDGKWDLSYYDPDGDGTFPLVGCHRNGEIKPYRAERVGARTSGR